MARRPAIGLADQGFSSLTNFATTALAARYSSPGRFGAVALAMSVAYMIMILARGLTAEPVIAKCPRLQGSDLRHAERDALAMAFLVGIVAGAATSTLALIPSKTFAFFIWVGVCIPAILVEDVLRYIGFARGRPGAALIADVTWAVVQFGLIASLLATHRGTLQWIVLSWGVGAVAGALAGATALSLYVLGSPRRWISRTSSYSFWVFPQLAVSQVSDQGTTVVLVVVFGASALGGIRAVQLFIRPVFVFMLALQALLVPALTRRLMAQGEAGLFRHARTLAIWVTAVSLVGATVAVADGRSLAKLLFGPSYVGYAKYMLPFAAGACLHASAALPSAGLRALQRGRRIFAVQLASSLITLTAVVTSALLATVYVTVWAVAVQGAAASILGWMALATASRARPDPALDSSPRSAAAAYRAHEIVTPIAAGLPVARNDPAVPRR